MARAPRQIETGMAYHVLNRSNNREKLFKKDKDYEAFFKIIFEAKEIFPIKIYVFCIMPNHWHFVLSPELEENVPKFMRWLTHTHTQRYHAHYDNIGGGHIYQGRYRSFPVSSDTYFLKVCRYVERNPLRAGLVEKAQDWKWSSLWIKTNGNSQQKAQLSDWTFDLPGKYIDWVNEPIDDEEINLNEIRNSVNRGSPFGEEDWVKEFAVKFGLNQSINPRGRPKK